LPCLYFKIQGADLYAYKDDAMTKVIFIHGLPGCDFLIIEEKGNPNNPGAQQKHGEFDMSNKAAFKENNHASGHMPL